MPVEKVTLKSVATELWRTLRGIGAWRWKNSLVFFGIVIGITAFFALLDFQGAVVSQLSYFTHRPVQIESTGSTILWIAAYFGYPAHVEYTFGSLNIVSALGNSVSQFFLLAFVLGYIYTIWLQWRGKEGVGTNFFSLPPGFFLSRKRYSPPHFFSFLPFLDLAKHLVGL